MYRVFASESCNRGPGEKVRKLVYRPHIEEGKGGRKGEGEEVTCLSMLLRFRSRFDLYMVARENGSIGDTLGLLSFHHIRRS